MSDNLKGYAYTMVLGVLIGITIAEGWRRAVYRDSYANYLPDAAEADDVPAETDGSGGPAGRAINRLWGPISATARSDWARLQRRRAGAPKPGAGVPVTPLA